VRHYLLALLPSVLVSAAWAQLPQTSELHLQPERALSPLRDAGTYHVATGTWTRAGVGQPQLGPDVIYNASRTSGYFVNMSLWENEAIVDEGILPSTSNPLFAATQDIYKIDGFQFAYCSLAGSVDWTFRFYESYVPCTKPSSPGNVCISESGQVQLTGLPGAGACWLVTVDLAGGYEICMEADGGTCAPGYQGPATGLDHFGWSATFVTDNGAPTGPFVAGADPLWAPEGEGTCYLPNLTCPQGPTANGALDNITLDFNGCANFGGYSNPNGCAGPATGLFAQLYMVLYTDCTVTCDAPYSVYCDTHPAQLGALGISSERVADGPVLTASGLAGGQFAYHLIGDGSGVIVDPPGSQGELCLAGSMPGIGRYALDIGPVVGDAISTDLINGVVGGGAGNLPNPPGGILSAGQTWNFQTWVRVPGSSRFSPAITVVFQ
jgi:hypothetical protein